MKKHVKHSIGWLAVLWHCVFLPVHYAHAQPVSATPPPSAQKANEGGGEVKGCCAFALQFVNLYNAEEHVINRIRVSAMCDTEICCADGEEWEQSGNAPYYVDWFPADSSYIPYGNAIDNEFLIYLSSETQPYNLQVEWIDDQGNVVCRHLIEIACNGHEKEDEDWTLYTSKTGLNDEHFFVFAVREEEEDEDACDDMRRSGLCSISSNITCSGIGNYLVTLNGNGDYDSFDWQIVSGPASPFIGSSASTSVTLNIPGTYLIAMDATDSATGDICSAETEIVIPAFNPGYVSERIPSPCSATFNFTATGAADPATVASVNWFCASLPGFSFSDTYNNSVQYTFLTAGTYSIVITIMDIYGCAHSVTQLLTVSFACVAGAEVDRYYLCGNCQGASNIDVYFNNTSTGGTCPLTFTWDFGDGSPLVTTTDATMNVMHTYAVTNCATANSYTVTITMTDSSPTPCSSTATLPFTIAPCRPEVTYRICPDGKVVCNSTVPGTFTFTPALTIIPWESSIPDAEELYTKVTVKVNTPGTYYLTFEGHCGTGGRCIINRTITVTDIHCCAKNDSERDKFNFSVGGNDYRMKYKMVQRQLIWYHKIRLKTKLKKRKTLWGIGYWKGNKADQIEAHCNGTIYKSDGVCNCYVPNPVSGSEILTSKTKAKFAIDIGDRFRSRISSLISSHRVVKDGYDVTKNLDLGNDCDH